MRFDFMVPFAVRCILHQTEAQGKWSRSLHLHVGNAPLRDLPTADHGAGSTLKRGLSARRRTVLRLRAVLNPAAQFEEPRRSCP